MLYTANALPYSFYGLSDLPMDEVNVLYLAHYLIEYVMCENLLIFMLHEDIYAASKHMLSQNPLYLIHIDRFIKLLCDAGLEFAGNPNFKLCV